MNTYSWALAIVAGCAAVCIALLVGFGVERREVRMHGAEPALAAAAGRSAAE
jgi:hypothetical protein